MRKNIAIVILSILCITLFFYAFAERRKATTEKQKSTEAECRSVRLEMKNDSLQNVLDEQLDNAKKTAELAQRAADESLEVALKAEANN